MRAVAVGAACSLSGAVVPADPVNISEGGIHVVENYMAAGKGGIEPKTLVLIPC
jgi:hypothetical protein